MLITLRLYIFLHTGIGVETCLPCNEPMSSRHSFLNFFFSRAFASSRLLHFPALFSFSSHSMPTVLARSLARSLDQQTHPASGTQILAQSSQPPAPREWNPGTQAATVQKTVKRARERKTGNITRRTNVFLFCFYRNGDERDDDQAQKRRNQIMSFMSDHLSIFLQQFHHHPSFFFSFFCFPLLIYTNSLALPIMSLYYSTLYCTT